MRIHRYLHLSVLVTAVTCLTVGCGNPAGTISNLRYQYAHAMDKTVIRVPTHFGTGVVMGDSQTWVDNQWGKPIKVDSGSNQNETVSYPGNVTVSFANARVSFIQRDVNKSWTLQKALSVVQSLLPPDSQVVMRHQAGSEVGQFRYEFKSAKLASLVTAKIWHDSMYEVPGVAYVLLSGNKNGTEINSIKIAMQTPNEM